MKNKTAYLFLAAAAIFFLSDTVQKLPYSPDDTFIYMQYARNISGGHGFSFNAGEPSYGVTSPFWVIILSIPYSAGINAFWFSKVLDVICAALSVFVFFRLAKIIFSGEKESFYPLLAASLFTLNVWFIRWSFTGMETNLGILMMLLVLYFYFNKNYSLSFFMCGLFFLIRPEGFILFLVILICVLIEKSKSYRNIIFCIILFAISVVPFLIYSKLTFGTFLSNTTLGKSTLTLNISTITAQIIEIAKTLAPSSGIEILLGIILIIIALKRKTLKQYLPLVLWPAGLILLYVITDADIISRYFMIIIPVFTLLAVKFIEIVNSKFNYSISLLLFAIILIFSQFSFYKYVKPHTDNFSKGVDECLIPIGKWFNENSPPNSRILVNDVGAIGYYSNKYIIDAAALINRDLSLNKRIMSTPLEERMHPYNLLKFINADYVVERDSVLDEKPVTIGGKRLELMYYKLFPGLGISDNTPKFYIVYKVSAN